MSGLLKLYPAAWRERYEAEVRDLLIERPPGIADRLDLVRGALDARLHPQVVGGSAPRQEAEPTVRPIGAALLAVIGGLLLAGGGIVQAASQVESLTGYKPASGVMLVIAGMLVTSLAAVARGWSDRASPVVLRRAAVATLLLTLLTAAPWPILVVGWFGYLIGTMVYGGILASSSQRIGVGLTVTALLAFGFNTENDAAFAVVPLGVAWMAAGAAGIRRIGRPIPVG
jgi:hypothetical protein